MAASAHPRLHLSLPFCGHASIVYCVVLDPAPCAGTYQRFSVAAALTRIALRLATRGLHAVLEVSADFCIRAAISAGWPGVVLNKLL